MSIMGACHGADGHIICNLCGEPGGICVCGFRDAEKVRKLVRDCAALEQERDEARRKCGNSNRDFVREREKVEGLREAMKRRKLETVDDLTIYELIRELNGKVDALEAAAAVLRTEGGG